MYPPNLLAARIGSSRFNRAPVLILEKEVRFQVSSARSALKDLGVISTAVRQTPLTAIESPLFSSFVRCEAETVSRRWPFSRATRLTLPTSSMIPVNMGVSSHHNPVGRQVARGHSRTQRSAVEG